MQYFMEKLLKISFDSETFRMKFTKFHAQFRSKICKNKERIHQNLFALLLHNTVAEKENALQGTQV